MLAALWHWLLTTRYTRALEDEVARLYAELRGVRAENRALVDSILGVAGVPPLKLDVAAQHPISSSRPGRADPAQADARLSPPLGVSAAPIRRRSWQQIGRMLEIEAARRKSTDK
jgi:hypothetical protein